MGLTRRRFRSGDTVQHKTSVPELFLTRKKNSNEAEMVPPGGDSCTHASGGGLIPPPPSADPSEGTGSRFRVSPVIVEPQQQQPQPKLSIFKSAPRRHRKSTARQNEWAELVTKGAVLPREQVTYVQYVSERQRKLQTALEDSVTHFRRRLQRTVNDAAWHCKREELWKRLLESGVSSSAFASGTGINQTGGGGGGGLITGSTSGAFLAPSGGGGSTTAGKQSRSRHTTGVSAFLNFSSDGGGTASSSSSSLLASTAGLSSQDPNVVLNQLTSQMTAQDLELLLTYTQVTPLTDVDDRLRPLLDGMRDDQAVLSLMRCLALNFGLDRCRYFVSAGSVHAGSKKHLVITNPNYLDSVVLVTSGPSRNSGARVSLVYKDWEGLIGEPTAEKKNYRLASVQQLTEQVVTCLAFQTWHRLLLHPPATSSAT